LRSFSYQLLVEKREEITQKLTQQRNSAVLEWAEGQTFTRFIGINHFIHKSVAWMSLHSAGCNNGLF